MLRLAEGLRHVRVDALLQAEVAGCRATVSVRDDLMTIEVPNVAAGWRFLRSALPRGLRHRLLQWIAASRWQLHFCIRRRVVLEAGCGKSGFLSLLGWPHVRLHPFSLTLAALGR